MRTALVIAFGAVLTSPVVGTEPGWNRPKNVPYIQVSSWWPEQEIQNNTIHKLRVPRGGMVDIIVSVEPNGVDLGKPTVTVTPSAPLAVVGLTVDGESAEPNSSIELDIRQRRLLRWTFQLPWQPRQAEREYRFDVTLARPSRGRRGRRERSYNVDLKASVTVEQGVSCYDTTMKRRLEMLARNEHCRLETIGKTVAGRDMYMLRVTDWTIPAAGKKQLIVIGPYHGDEPNGTETSLDFAYELIAMPANKRYLEGMVFYIVPSHNPDGHETGRHHAEHKIDIGNYAYEEMKIPEAINVSGVLRKYADQFTDAMELVHHQWGRDYTLIAHMDAIPVEQSPSCRIIRNVCIRVSNEFGRFVSPAYSVHPKGYKYTGVRGFTLEVLGIPNFTVENMGFGGFNIGDQIENISIELAIYYATADQMLAPEPVQPKRHEPRKLSFPPERNYKAYRTSAAPVIDGKLDEPCWVRDSVITDFRTIRRSREQQWNTTVNVTYDDENLYVGFKVPDLMGSETAENDSSAEVVSSDGCEVMLDTNLNQWTYSHLMASSSGAFGMRYCPCPGVFDDQTQKAKGYKVAASVASGAIEMCIPLAAFNHPERVDPPLTIPIPDGTVWGANFVRTEHDGKPLTAWAETTNQLTHRPWEFNAITFMGARPK